MSDDIEAGLGGVGIGFSDGGAAAGWVLNTSASVLPVLGQVDFAKNEVRRVG